MSSKIIFLNGCAFVGKTTLAKEIQDLSEEKFFLACQKQLANIDNVLRTKKSAAVFLFDEADNALDREKQKEFNQKLTSLVKEKLVIYVKHETSKS